MTKKAMPSTKSEKYSRSVSSRNRGVAVALVIDVSMPSPMSTVSVSGTTIAAVLLDVNNCVMKLEALNDPMFGIGSRVRSPAMFFLGCVGVSFLSGS